MMAWLAFVTTAAQLNYTLPRLAGRATLVGAHLSKLRGRTRNHLHQRREGHRDRGQQQLTALGLLSRPYGSADYGPSVRPTYGRWLVSNRSLVFVLGAQQALD